MRATVHIQNFECCGCERIITSSLSQITNISDVKVNSLEKTVTFNFHTNHDFENAKHVLSRIGYPIVGRESHLNI
ncbi:heavy-metal-associated domain-containing protein [Winogradskyella sp.]|uniref:heavy-metal-associated domain-containing protein n=1 Tax=Winogradskyella sp. TaxID=1883156 RepID=UPI003F6C6633